MTVIAAVQKKNRLAARLRSPSRLCAHQVRDFSEFTLSSPFLSGALCVQGDFSIVGLLIAVRVPDKIAVDYNNSLVGSD